jgi:hypothetical protein
LKQLKHISAIAAKQPKQSPPIVCPSKRKKTFNTGKADMKAILLILAALAASAAPAAAVAVVDGSPVRPLDSGAASKGDRLDGSAAKGDQLPVAGGQGFLQIPGLATVAFLVAPGQSVAVRIPLTMVSVD